MNINAQLRSILIDYIFSIIVIFIWMIARSHEACSVLGYYCRVRAGNRMAFFKEFFNLRATHYACLLVLENAQRAVRFMRFMHLQTIWASGRINLKPSSFYLRINAAMRPAIKQVSKRELKPKNEIVTL